MRVGLMGRGIGIKRCIDALEKHGDETAFIITEPKSDHLIDDDVHQMQMSRGLYASVFEIAEACRIPLRETSDVNEPDTIQWIQTSGADVVVSAGCRSIIRKPFLEACGGTVLNLHTAPLPRYRGRASDSWMILNDEREAYGVCHFVDEGIDSGDLLAKASYTIPEGSYPIDIYERRMSVIGDLLTEALENLADPGFQPIRQEEAEVTYFPGLNTERDGWIDWTLDAPSIERHVRAFGVPYAGASTLLSRRRIVVLRGSVEPNPPRLHPRTAGLIFGYDGKGGVRVSAGEGVYVVSEVRVDGVTGPARELLRLGRCFEVQARDGARGRTGAP